MHLIGGPSLFPTNLLDEMEEKKKKGAVKDEEFSAVVKKDVLIAQSYMHAVTLAGLLFLRQLTLPLQTWLLSV